MTTPSAQAVAPPGNRPPTPRRRWYTTELLGAYQDGKEIIAGGLDQPVIYQPRTKYDPQPWCTVSTGEGSTVLRFTGRECYARDPQTGDSADTRLDTSATEQQNGAA